MLGGRYQLGTHLGSGSDVVVYDAVDLQLEREVTVKIVVAPGSSEPAFHVRFRELAAALVALSHPNIVTVLDYGEQHLGGRDLPYLVTERVGGGSLADILDRGRTLTPSQALIVGLDVCRGLDHAHRAGLVHGFIRPSRLLLGEDRRVRVAEPGLDLLIARHELRQASDIELDSARFLAPEQIRDLIVGPKADVYSLALTLVRSVTGTVPFGGDTTVATLTNRVDKLLPVSADLGALASVLERAGRPKPQERSSAAEFGRSLVDVARKLPKPAPLPLATGSSSLFEAPAGQETTSELTRFRDSTGALVRDDLDVTGSLTRPTEPTKARVVALDERGDATDESVTRPKATILVYLALVIGLVGATALGVIALRKLTTKTHEVPSLIGLAEGQARNEVAGFDWVVTVRAEATESQAQGNVFRTEPSAGASLNEGEEFTMYVSAGPPLVSLPELVGATVDEATALLGEAHLTLAIGEERYDEAVPAGEIIVWVVSAQPTLTAGDEVVQGTIVTAVVSKGPIPRTVPDLVGMTMDEAAATVEPLALGVLEAGEAVFSAEIPAGAIASQDQEVGGSVAKGTVINVVLSKGPDLRAVPNVIMLPLADARAALEAAGFTIGEIKGIDSGVVVGVGYQDRQLAVGEQLPVGTALDLAVI
ncbi:MAG: PASTA domain-containing protein [Ilumatobacteraceae bacterium]